MAAPPPKTTLELNPELQQVSNNSYITAAKRVGAFIAGALTFNHVLTKTSLAQRFPRWKSTAIDNRLYTLAILTVMLTQYTIKTEELEGVSTLNENKFSRVYQEEFEEIQRREQNALLKQKSSSNTVFTPLPPHSPAPIVANNLVKDLKSDILLKDIKSDI